MRGGQYPSYTTRSPNGQSGVAGSIPNHPDQDTFTCSCHRKFPSLRALHEHMQTSVQHGSWNSDFIVPDRSYTAKFQEV